MMRSIAVIALSFLRATITQAQCAGVNVGGGQCLPPDAPGMPYDHQHQSGQQMPQIKPVWADRWGAIAVDNETGDAGTVEGRASKSSAEKMALEICAKNGSKNCKVTFSFHNQCAAVALDEGVSSGDGGGTTKEIAEQMAINACGHSNSCKIVYSACSLPERIR